MTRAGALLALLLLAGCGTTQQAAPDIRVDANRMDANVRTRCAPLPPLPAARPLSMGDLLTFAGNLVAWGEECAARDGAKADWIESQGQ